MEGIITVAGCMPRIGTTTQALQLARYIAECSDYKVAYVECNAQNYIWSASEMYYAVKKDKTGGHINLEGLDLYAKERLEELTAGGVDIDFLVCDYGDMNAREFDKKGFLNGSVKIFVGGVKPNELYYSERALRIPEYADAVYVFSYVPKQDQEEIRQNMGMHAEDTFFAPYTPDPLQHMNQDVANNYYVKLMPHLIKRIAG